MILDDNPDLRAYAHHALTVALEHNFSNDIVAPLLAATRGEARLHLEEGCPVHDDARHLLIVEDPREVREMLRTDDAFLHKMLEKQRFEALMTAQMRGQR